MEINRLKTFLVIAKNGSFKSAAELLFLSHEPFQSKWISWKMN
ncbi:hypothetical protein [Lactiplantibacillus pentosus]